MITHANSRLESSSCYVLHMGIVHVLPILWLTWILCQWFRRDAYCIFLWNNSDCCLSILKLSVEVVNQRIAESQNVGWSGNYYERVYRITVMNHL